MSEDCVFCKIISGEITSDRVLENDHLIVIKDLSPKAPVHLLIIPKLHLEDIQSIETEEMYVAEHIFSAAKELSKKVPDAEHFKLAINSGYDAGQRVFHLHVHFLAGKISKEALASL